MKCDVCGSHTNLYLLCENCRNSAYKKDEKDIDNYESDCCHAPLIHMGHNCWVCSKCSRACDVHRIGYCDCFDCTIKSAEKKLEFKPIEELKGDWVTDSECLTKVTAKVDELVREINHLKGKEKV
jgi:hypothetical protein